MDQGRLIVVTVTPPDPRVADEDEGGRRGTLVTTHLSPDKSRRVRTFQRPDGSFFFQSGTYGVFTTYENDETDHYWVPVDELAAYGLADDGREIGTWQDGPASGLYATADAAERDAGETHPWLAEATVSRR